MSSSHGCLWQPLFCRHEMSVVVFNTSCKVIFFLVFIPSSLLNIFLVYLTFHLANVIIAIILHLYVILINFLLVNFLVSIMVNLHKCRIYFQVSNSYIFLQHRHSFGYLWATTGLCTPRHNSLVLLSTLYKPLYRYLLANSVKDLMLEIKNTLAKSSVYTIFQLTHSIIYVKLTLIWIH